MLITAVLLRWYRSFNVMSLGPSDPVPPEPWHSFGGQSFPFIEVPLDRLITTVVGANESGKSHLLSAIAKVINGEVTTGTNTDRYEIKDICRYCGGGLAHSWPELGIKLGVAESERALFLPPPPGDSAPTGRLAAAEPSHEIAIVLNGGKRDQYAVCYVDATEGRTFTEDEWRDFAARYLPSVAILDASMALPNDIHVDELLDAYAGESSRTVVDTLKVQELWRAIEPIDLSGAADPQTLQRIGALKNAISASTRRIGISERQLVLRLFRDVLGITRADLDRIRQYTGTERGYVSWLSDDINSRIDRELDIARYWDQDEAFTLRVNYKSGTFHFEISDRTGTTYTFNERSSGLKYFLSYYIQAKALEKEKHANGAVILMDEPDNFLSASGQRSLLRVFESLVSHKTSHGQCQLVYTTHSPFLINKNFPDRLKLVRKGEGSEGTQYVQRSAVRRFEPVRSALAIDAAGTLFLGSTNVVVEGYTDQKLLVSAIQRFSKPGRGDELLDLNKVTIVSAGGASLAPTLVEQAMKGDEKPPIVVVMLDGDGSGEHFAGEVAKYIDPKQVCTLRAIQAPEQAVLMVLEDMLPVSVVEAALKRCASQHGWTFPEEFTGTMPGTNAAERLVMFCRKHNHTLNLCSDMEIRGTVIDCVVDLLDDLEFKDAGLDILAGHVYATCAELTGRIGHAERNAKQFSLKKAIRLQLETFAKRFTRVASKADVRTLLEDMRSAALGTSADFERARQNLDRLVELLDVEARDNAEDIHLRRWIFRLERFRNAPWAKIADWGSLGKNLPTDAGESLPDDSASGKSLGSG